MKQGLIEVLSYLYRTPQSKIEICFSIKESNTPTIPSFGYCQLFIEGLKIESHIEPHLKSQLEETRIFLNSFYEKKSPVLKAFFNTGDYNGNRYKFNYFDFCFLLEKEHSISKSSIDTHMLSLKEKEDFSRLLPMVYSQKPKQTKKI